MDLADLDDLGALLIGALALAAALVWMLAAQLSKRGTAQARAEVAELERLFSLD